MKKLLLVLCAICITSCSRPLVTHDWNPKSAGDRVLAGLIKVTAPEVKGAHDAEFAIVDDKAYIVAEVNDERGGENAA